MALRLCVWLFMTIAAFKHELRECSVLTPICIVVLLAQLTFYLGQFLFQFLDFGIVRFRIDLTL